ncbi:hypothetical protein KOSB73_260644 [Klebsiella grimontii]|uniref:Uncharacterized protein n=1 Tax=Klebsiella grimontii TaxID=2058152 RepID=A0A285B4S3_9ENTR|nr:hypothetical protein KOSB73_260644 [Klebsiella grimontii]
MPSNSPSINDCTSAGTRLFARREKNIYAKLFKLHRGGKHVKAQGTYSGKRQSQTGAANKDAA